MKTFIPGQVIQIQYTITNVGPGPTKSKRWIDSIYWSKDSNYGINFKEKYNVINK